MAKLLNYETVSGLQSSFAEDKIAAALNEQNIPFEREVTFPGCVNPQTGKSLRFDFYLPSANTLIEYDGKEFHADVTVRKRDRLKTEFAAKAGIRLIRIQGISNIEKLFLNELDIKLNINAVDPQEEEKKKRAAVRAKALKRLKKIKKTDRNQLFPALSRHNKNNPDIQIHHREI